MGLNEVKQAVGALSVADFDTLLAWIVTSERDRRDKEKARMKAEITVIADLIKQGIVEGPAWFSYEEAYEMPLAEFPLWVDPAGNTTKAYPPEAIVRHGDRVWMSVEHERMNVAPPGEGTSWEDVTDDVVLYEGEGV